MSQHHKKILFVSIGIVLGGLTALVIAGSQHTQQAIAPTKTESVVAPIVPIKAVPKPVTITGTVYHTVVLATTEPVKELTALVGIDNVQTVLEINRIDSDNIKKGSVLTIPNSFVDSTIGSPFPASIVSASDIPKLMLVSLQMQAFAVYESGALIRWGGVNTGKQSTPTPDELYFANWKGKSVVSSEDDSWVLPWYVNLDNKRGVSMHQYALPGYPASHACIRMFEQDAEWIYNWVDQWKVSDDGETVLAHGTPVLIFGKYGYGKTAPWKKLAKDPTATTLSEADLESIVSTNKAMMNK